MTFRCHLREPPDQHGLAGGVQLRLQRGMVAFRIPSTDPRFRRIVLQYAVRAMETCDTLSAVPERSVVAAFFACAAKAANDVCSPAAGVQCARRPDATVTCGERTRSGTPSPHSANVEFNRLAPQRWGWVEAVSRPSALTSSPTGEEDFHGAQGARR
jgi:hypothetical protein